jgi:flagellar protein FliO/FliZ
MQLLPALVRLSAFALSGVLLAPALAVAADGEQTPLALEAEAKPQAAEHVGASGANIVRTIVGLAVVIGVIYGLHWILKQVKTGREQQSTGGGLDTLSTLQLSPGRALHLVRSGSEIVLVGSAEHGVTPIRIYSEDEARALGLLDEIERHEGDDGDRDHRDAAGRRRSTPLHASGSPATLRDFLTTVRQWTVRR